MVRHPIRNHVFRPCNLSHNTTGISDAANIWPRRHLKHQACCRLGTHLTWFTRYPLLQRIVFDRGTEFLAEFSKMCHNDYGLKRKHITTSNPQSNAIIERIHQTIGNIIRTFEVTNIVNNDPWSGILSATMFAVRAIYHTTLQASLMQLEFC